MYNWHCHWRTLFKHETNNEFAQVDDDEFVNVFSTPLQDQGETSSRHVDSSNMHTFYQQHPSAQRWTKDHPLEQVIGNPFNWFRTGRQLENRCGDVHVRTHSVWLLCKNVINLKWLRKKRDEENTMILQQSCLVAKDYAQKEEIDVEDSIRTVVGWKLSVVHCVRCTEILQMDLLTMYLMTKFSITDKHLGSSNSTRAWYENSSTFVSKGFSKGIQIHQSPRGIFINQAKYAQEILKKHGMTSCDSIGTPMATKHLDADLSGDTGFDTLTAFSILNHACYLRSVRGTSGGIQFIGGDKLVSWSSKKQDCTSMSSAEAESSAQHSRTKHRCQKSLHKRNRCLTPDELEVLAIESA
ncbi:hypothetical protein Tco_0368736 [Tanacetum coccineum]